MTEKGFTPEDDFSAAFDGLEEALEATLEAFRDVSPDAPPIPEENITYTERNLRAFVLRGTKAWSNLFTILSRDYWRR